MVGLDFCQRMPKVELHVHFEGSVRPETVLKLAKRHGVELQADTVEGLRDWYTFRDFPHFVQVYVAVTKCIRTGDDLELVMREFLEGQAAQNIHHTEVTYTASTLESHSGIPFDVQIAALRKGLAYGRDELGVSCGLILDIVRGCDLEQANKVAQWVIDTPEVVALGLAGEERRGTEIYAEAFANVREAGKPIIPHAGETVGPESVWSVLEHCQPLRVGHGVRSVEDPKLIVELREKQIPLEVCPTSNVRLGVYPSLAEHSLPRLLDEGLYVTINSDDPPMFGTTLSEEFYRCAQAFEFSEDILWSLTQNAVNAACLSGEVKRDLVRKMRAEFQELVDDGDLELDDLGGGVEP